MDDIGCVQAAYGVSPRGWMCTANFIQWLNEVFLPGAKANAPSGYENGPFYLVLDGHSSHIANEVLQIAKEANVYMIRLPSNSTHVLQPLDYQFLELQNSFMINIFKIFILKIHTRYFLALFLI